MPDLTQVAEALNHFNGDPHRADRLASVLGFEPIHTPADLLAGHATPLNRFLDSRFGVSELYRVGQYAADGSTIGLYIGVLNEWGSRASDRDRPRRRLARALVEHQPDARSMFIMVPNALHQRREAEFVLPRSVTGARAKRESTGTISTVRALVELREPNRFHRELLCDLAILRGASLLDISREWQHAFSVERATKVFYQEYAKVRDRVAEALKASNPNHPVVRTMSDETARAWATRQLGRILFLWFLQSKGWLGYNWSDEERAGYLLKLWPKRTNVTGGFYRGILIPLFFEAMAKRNPGTTVRDLLGYTPYLNGGLFRRNRLEDQVEEKGTVDLPDALFDPRDEESVLGLLRRYRFTTQESTPDSQSVDPDPELLGRVFENLYQGDQRHDTGTYYTPREIVQFMCREALDGYLRHTAGVDQSTLDRLRKQATEPDEEPSPLPPAVEERLINTLEGMRVCDPAVGSGAFLVGVMQEIIHLRRGTLHTKRGFIDPNEEDRTVAGWKRHAITWNLYGVDINPEAVELCQLRLWLSLVLDIADPREVDPLPNLDFRIMAGDSLVDRVGDITFAESLPFGTRQLPMELSGRVAREEQQIERWRREFEATQDNPPRLRELRDSIAKASLRIVRLHLDAEIEKAREIAASAGKERQREKSKAYVKHLEELRGGLDGNAPYLKPFLWPVAFPEVFKEGGFDIVLANPPYIRQERLLAEDQDAYKQAFPEVFAGTADILVFFYARAIQILKKNGWLAFITSNKYMRAAYGEGIRTHLPKSLGIHRAIDFGDLPLFEANGKTVAAYPAVMVGKRNGKQSEHTARVADLTYPVRLALKEAGLNVNSENVRLTLEDLPGLLASSEIPDYPQALLRPRGWILEDPALVRLFERLMNQGTPLGKFVEGRMYRGVLTGLNEAFVIDQAKRDELIAQDPKSAELIKPWLRGRDIKRWRAEWAGLYIIAIQNSGDSGANHPWAKARSEAEARRIFKKTYPALHDHLSKWEEYPDPRRPGHTLGLRPRADQGRFWWELRACAYYAEFAQPKVIWGNLAVKSKFALDISCAFVSAPANILSKPNTWLVAMMNSALANFIYPKLTVLRGGGYQEFKTGYIAPTPIVMPEPRIQEKLIQLQDRLTSEGSVKPDELERVESEIDNLVFHIYGISNAEAKMLSEWIEMHRANLSTETEPSDEGDDDD